MNTKSMRFLFGIVFCSVMAIPVVCSASAAMGAAWNVAAVSPQAFAEQAATLLREMEPDGRYGELGPAARSVVADDLETIGSLLQHRGSAAKLNDREQVEMMNAQERIRAVLTNSEADQLICTLEPRTGTNFKIKICMTKFARDEIRRKSQEGYQDGLLQGGGALSRGN